MEAYGRTVALARPGSRLKEAALKLGSETHSLVAAEQLRISVKRELIDNAARNLARMEASPLGAKVVEASILCTILQDTTERVCSYAESL